MAHNGGKGRICVTGGTGYLGSWIVKKLLEEGYSVNTTTRMDSGRKRDLSFLTNLDGAGEKLQIFHADMNSPESFLPAIEGCVGVFHTAHPLDFAEKETEEVKILRITTALKVILKGCADSKTVRRVVYTSSVAAIAGNKNDSDIIDESSWTDVDFIRSLKTFGGPYVITKTVTEKLALDLAQELGLDLVTVCPPWITGPFICSHLPDSISATLALIFRDEKYYGTISDTSMVHVDDVARAHIHLFEYPEARGRYICTAAHVTVEELRELITRKYPQYELPIEESWKSSSIRVEEVSGNKLRQTGFEYEYGLEEMIVGAVESCKQKGFL